MELLTSLPPDLAAFADPSVRGPAPLLRPPDGDAAPATGATPFELCLALLTGVPTGGESWPATGKELPPLPLDSAAGELDQAALLAFTPTAFADVALQSRLPSAETPLPAATIPLTPTLPRAAAADALALSLPNAETAAAGAAAPQATALDPLAALATGDAAPLPLEGGEQQPAAAAAKTPAQPSWLEAFTSERRLQRPVAAAAADARAAAEPTTAPDFPAALQPSSATAAVVEATPGAQAGVRRVEMQKALVAAVAATEGASSPEWLPPATGHAAPTGGTALASTAAAAAPQAPVDLRSPGWQEAFASRVQVLVDTKIGEAHIKLNPPELGAVDVKISLVDDRTFVQLTTATAAARDELAHALPRLRELFTVSGLELGGASVHDGRDHYQAGQGHGSSGGHAAARSSPLASFMADGADGFDAPALAPRRSLGRIDTFA